MQNEQKKRLKVTFIRNRLSTVRQFEESLRENLRVRTGNQHNLGKYSLHIGYNSWAIGARRWYSSLVHNSA